MRWVLLGGAVFALALTRSLTDGFGLADESWFLQVVSRMLGGEVLYRDLFLGTTPLAIYATAAVASVLGTEIIAVKIVTNAAFAAATALAVFIARRLGVSTTGALALVAGALFWARPFSNPPYTAVAVAFLLATLAAVPVARWTGRRGLPTRAVLLAGIWAGLSFAAKPNVGLLALGLSGLSLTLVAPSGGQLWRAAAVGLGGFVGSVSLVLAPVAASSGLAGLWEYGFAGKGAYLALGSVSYVGSVLDWLGQLGRLPAPEAITSLARGGVLLLPVVAAAVALAAWSRLTVDRRIAVMFGVAATLVAFPRWDRFHLAYAAIPLLLAIVVAWPRRAEPDVGATWMPRLAGGALVVVALTMVLPLFAYLAGGTARRVSTLDHFRGALIEPARQDALESSAAALARAAGQDPLFVLSLEAGFWHLASGVQNPTPFDIPAVTSVGRTGERQLIDQIRSGSLPQVCLDNQPDQQLMLSSLYAYVLNHLDPGPDVGPCTVYRVPAAADARLAGRIAE